MELYETKPVRVRAKQYTQEMQDSFIAIGDDTGNSIDVKLDFAPDLELKWWRRIKQLHANIGVNAYEVDVDVSDYIVLGSDGVYDVLTQHEFEQKYKKILDLEKMQKAFDNALENITPETMVKYFPSVAENELNIEPKYNKADAQSKSLIALREHLANMTPKEKEEMQEHFRDKRPKGWLSIEEHLPMMYAKDIEQWHSVFKVKFTDGSEGESKVGDGNTWYYHAKEAGVTHWFNE